MRLRAAKRPTAQAWRQLQDQWAQLNQAISRSPDEATTEWFKQVVGARVDCAPSRLHPADSGSAMLLWDYVGLALRAGRRDLCGLWNELERVEPAWHRLSTEIVGLHDRPGMDGESMTLVSQRLLAGHFAAARGAVCIALGSSGRILRPVGAYDPRRSLGDDLLQAIVSYYEFWSGEQLSLERAERCRRTLEGIADLQPEHSARLRRDFGAAWATLQEALTDDLVKRSARLTALAMLRRVVDWLLGSLDVDAEPLRTWILLAEGANGNCARLLLTAVDQGQHEPLAFPDPIRLGLLPVDEVWRSAFDAASLAVKTCSDPAAGMPRVAWSLEFLSPQVVRELLQTSGARLGSLSRPCFIRGPSASAAFAALWATGAQGLVGRGDVAISAEVTSDGELKPVRGFPAKLDGQLWHAFLDKIVRRVVVCPDEVSCLDGWTQMLADRVGHSQEFLQRPRWLKEAVALLAVEPATMPIIPPATRLHLEWPEANQLLSQLGAALRWGCLTLLLLCAGVAVWASLRPNPPHQSYTARTPERQRPSFPPPEINSGTWLVEGAGDDAVLRQTALLRHPMPVLAFGSFDWSNYDITLQARVDRGNNGLKFAFHYLNMANCAWFALGNYENTKHEVTYMRNNRFTPHARIDRDGSLVPGRWYDIRLVIRDHEFHCYLDGALVESGLDPFRGKGRVALGAWNTATSYRKLRITTPEGAVLWEGLPPLRSGRALSE